MNYFALLGDIKSCIQSAQTRAMLAVNSELVRLYWEVGQLLDQRQRDEGWGKGTLPRLAKDLHNDFPELKGFSERNLDRMVAFYREYQHGSLFSPPVVAKTETSLISPPPVAKLALDAKNDEIPENSPFSSEILRTVPWAHHGVLLEKVKDRVIRRWYMEQLVANGWSRNILAMQIETQAHKRQGAATTNFRQKLPPFQSDLVQQVLKDPYIFDFLTLEKPFRERELEIGLVLHIEKFLLELGQGFAFVGRQYHLVIGEDDFYIDLLFYHFKLRCFVVIELKNGEFKPEYAGKLNFYCNVVDDKLRHATDQPTIGLILCKTKDDVLAEYSLRGIDKPIGIASYELTRSLPDQLKSVLPTIEEIEAELNDIDEAFPIEPGEP